MEGKKKKRRSFCDDHRRYGKRPANGTAEGSTGEGRVGRRGVKKEGKREDCASHSAVRPKGELKAGGELGKKTLYPRLGGRGREKAASINFQDWEAAVAVQARKRDCWRSPDGKKKKREKGRRSEKTIHGSLLLPSRERRSVPGGGGGRNEVHRPRQSERKERGSTTPPLLPFGREKGKALDSETPISKKGKLHYPAVARKRKRERDGDLLTHHALSARGGRIDPDLWGGR